MKLLSSHEVHSFDASLDLDLEVIISKVAEQLYESLRQHYSLDDFHLIFIAGPGLNGKDAEALYRICQNQKLSCELISISDLQKDSLSAIEKLKSIKASLSECDEQAGRKPAHQSQQSLGPNIKRPIMIIDGLFGVGIRLPLSSSLKRLIVAMNCLKHSNKAKIVSIDLPSGLEANNGLIDELAVKAEMTLVIEFLKPGLFLNAGPSYAGKKILVKKIFSEQQKKKAHSMGRFLTRGVVQKLFPPKTKYDNKYTNGQACVMVGSSQFPGAAQLVAESALRSGLGYLQFFNRHQVAERFPPEAVPLSWSQFEKQILQENRARSFVIGSGVPAEDEHLRKAIALSFAVSQNGSCPSGFVIDGGGLRALSVFLSQNGLSLKDVPSNWVLLPHDGELNELNKNNMLNTESLGDDHEKLKRKWDIATQLAEQIQCQLVWKGHRSLCISPKRIFLIPTGNRALAKAGSGDVLAGMIGSLVAQNLSSSHLVGISLEQKLLRSVLVGTYWHGWIADEWLRVGHSERSLMVSDLLKLPPLKSN